MSQKLRFINTQNSLFFSTVRSRVDNFFMETGKSRNANAGMWFKAVFFISSFVLLYLLIILNAVSLPIMLFLCVVLGMVCAFIGFNVCHDAIHGSLSENRTVNKVFSFFFYLIGANPYVWNITHNIVHHTYTNIPGHDEDIEIAPGLIRIAEEDKVNRIQRYQHWYALPLYSIASLSWVFRKDYKKFFQKSVGKHSVKHPPIEYFNLFFYKFLYYFLFIGLPLLVLNVQWWHVMVGFLALHLTEGLTMGLVFQLAHVVEGTTFPSPKEDGNIDEAWAIHQMRTTANFATHNKLAAFFLGGLNRQIEHHLFPKVCHIHYGEISSIVKQTATEFNLPYIENKTFTSALASHIKTLKKFSRDA